MAKDDEYIYIKERVDPSVVHIVRGDEIYHVGDPSRIGKLVALGKQQSEVQWPDVQGTRVVSNDTLRRA